MLASGWPEVVECLLLFTKGKSTHLDPRIHREVEPARSMSREVRVAMATVTTRNASMDVYTREQTKSCTFLDGQFSHYDAHRFESCCGAHVVYLE
jgi:hypothetical protein